MKQFINSMIAQISAINSTMQITYEDGLLTVGSGQSICVTDNEAEQRAVLAGVLLGLTAPKPVVEDVDYDEMGDEDECDEEDEAMNLQIRLW